MRQFDEVITDEARLREITGTPGDLARDKVIDHVDAHVAHFIEKSPFLLMSTRGGDRREDISPKGDPAGFVRVLDAKTLAIPDRPGNRRMDSFSNLMVDDQIGLIFLIPGHRETLRISGRARIVLDAELSSEMAVNGRTPELIVIVEVEEACMHCPKCVIRSGLWTPENWPDMDDFPSMAAILKDHANETKASVADVQSVIDASARDRLY